MTIPPGIWLGMEDSRNHAGATFYDYNDFCVVLVGCKAIFRARVPNPDPANVTWDDRVQELRLINMVNGILDRTVENKY